MKLTTKKLESLILEMMEMKLLQPAYSNEQEDKIFELVQRSLQLLEELEGVSGFFPITINSVYSWDKKEDIHKAIRKSLPKPIKDHYKAVQRIVQILEELNQYLFLIESLEIKGEIARDTKWLLYDDVIGPSTAQGRNVELDELAAVVDGGIFFLEDVQEANPGLLGQGNLGFEAYRDIVESFNKNYFNLKNYLDSVV